jgi:mono/diheme cytochrome c family protein
MRHFLRITFLLFGCVVLSGCHAPASAPSNPADENAAGHKIYIAKCAKCHKLYDPAKYSDAEWEKWMGKMAKKARLTPEQRVLVSHYIDQNFRPPSGSAP